VKSFISYIREYIVKSSAGFSVKSKKGRNLGGPYASKSAAVKRLGQVEYFKHMKEAMTPLRDRLVQQADVVGKKTGNASLRARALALFNRGENPTSENKATLKAANSLYKKSK